MGRIIKFRAKRVDDGGWAYGFLVGKTSERAGDASIQVEEDFWVSVVPETVGQFTGLKDKDGKEIWEGDVVSYVSLEQFDSVEDLHVVAVKHDDNRSGFFPMSQHVECEDGYYDYKVTDVCVIGNIHDNPELLK